MFEYIDYYRVALLTIPTLIIIVFCYKRLTSLMQRTFLLTGTLGLYIYAGFGAAYSFVPMQYIICYLLFAVFMAIAFLLTIKITGGLFKGNYGSATSNIAYLQRNPLFIFFIIAAYIFCGVFPLIYPTFRLNLLWNPPAPDLNTIFNAGLPIEVGILATYVSYLYFFLYPFYLIIISRFLPKYMLVLFFLSLPVYLEYCANAYVGRSAMGIVIAMFVLTLIFAYPHRIRRILISAFLALPILLIFFSAYAFIREDNDIYQYISVTDLIMKIIFDETRFPIFAEEIMQYAATVDLLQYARYIFFYPIPGEKLNIGFDIAELIMNLQQGQEGFSVTLTGAVTESIYIFGQTFFWLQALLMGAVFGLLCRFSESMPRYPIIGAFFITLWGYKFARAGISSIWPIIYFHMIPFYILTMVPLKGNRNANKNN